MIFKERKLVIASHNRGKVREIAALLAPLNLEVISAADISLSEPEETGTTFAENAIIKAETAAQESGLPSVADDSGLCVNALNGEPGIYSARWAGPEKDFGAAMKKIQDRLGNNPEKSATFLCILALAIPGQPTRTFEGRVEGQFVWPPRGDKGFGYDPVFVPRGYEQTFAEMDPAAKHAISHRARAFEELVKHLRG